MSNQKKNIIQPKWIKGFKEIPFSKLSQIDSEGQTVEFEPSDKGKFAEVLYSWLDFELLINNLPEKEKQAIKLKAEGLSRKEIAGEMKIKPNAAKQLIYRAYRKIKEKRARVRKNQLGYRLKSSYVKTKN